MTNQFGGGANLLERRILLNENTVIDDKVPPLNIDLISVYGREKGFLNVNGIVENWGNYEVSDYIPCNDDMTFEINVEFNHGVQVHRYDANKQCISKQKSFKVVETTGTGQFGNGTSFPFEENTAYIRVSVGTWKTEHDNKYYCKRLK